MSTSLLLKRDYFTRLNVEGAADKMAILAPLFDKFLFRFDWPILLKMTVLRKATANPHLTGKLLDSLKLIFATIGAFLLSLMS